jgi:hypothetical protein
LLSFAGDHVCPSACILLLARSKPYTSYWPVLHD